ncbi:MAG: NYN domain-containing protein [bacterium]
MRVRVVIDGTNLHAGLQAQSSLAHYYWLDPSKLCQHIGRLHWPASQVEHLYYCTAPVRDQANDRNQRTRQETYFNALRSLSDCELVLGFHTRTVPPVEKQTDVNVASYMLWDALQAGAEGIILISNDVDLATPVRLIAQELGIPTLVLVPCRWIDRSVGLHGPNVTLRDLREGDLIASQFPDEIQDTHGTIRKPARPW